MSGSSAIATGYGGVGVSWAGSTEYASNAIARIAENDISLSCLTPTLNPSSDGFACVAAFHLVGTHLMQGSSSAFRIESNTISITKGLLANLPAITSTAGTLVPAIFSFAKNTTGINSFGIVGGDYLTIGLLSLSGNMFCSYNQNKITLTGGGTTGTGIGFSALTSVSLVEVLPAATNNVISITAQLAMSENIIRSSGCYSSISIRSAWSQGSKSRFILNDNDMQRTDAPPTTGSMMLFFKDASFSSQGGISLGLNIWGPPAFTPSNQLLGYGDDKQVRVVGPGGCIRACSNTVFGTRLTDLATIKNYAATGIDSVVSNVGCYEEEDSPTTATSAQNTGAPTSSTNAPTTQPSASAEPGETEGWPTPIATPCEQPNCPQREDPAAIPVPGGDFQFLVNPSRLQQMRRNNSPAFNTFNTVTVGLGGMLLLLLSFAAV